MNGSTGEGQVEERGKEAKRQRKKSCPAYAEAPADRRAKRKREEWGRDPCKERGAGTYGRSGEWPAGKRRASEQEGERRKMREVTREPCGDRADGPGVRGQRQTQENTRTPKTTGCGTRTASPVGLWSTRRDSRARWCGGVIHTKHRKMGAKRMMRGAVRILV